MTAKPNGSKDYRWPAFAARARYVAFCDILGFKALLQERGASDLARDVTELVADAEELLATHTVNAKVGRERVEKIPHLAFSDSILVWSRAAVSRPDPTFGSSFFVCLNLLFLQALARGLPLRVGVAYGPCVVRPEMGVFVGQPIVDAYETEGAQDWIGIACHESCEQAPSSASLRIEMRDDWYLGPLVRYEIPLKAASGAVSNWTTNWPFWSGGDPAIRDALCVGLERSRDSVHEDRWTRTLTYYDSIATAWSQLTQQSTPRSHRE